MSKSRWNHLLSRQALLQYLLSTISTSQRNTYMQSLVGYYILTVKLQTGLNVHTWCIFLVVRVRKWSGQGLMIKKEMSQQTVGCSQFSAPVSHFPDIMQPNRTQMNHLYKHIGQKKNHLFITFLPNAVTCSACDNNLLYFVKILKKKKIKKKREQKEKSFLPEKTSRPRFSQNSVEECVMV